MNIKNNIINYLYDKDYVLAMYDDFIYVFNYAYLESFNDKKISLKLSDRIISFLGENLTIKKITKEELLIKGNISNIEVKEFNG